MCTTFSVIVPKFPCLKPLLVIRIQNIFLRSLHSTHTTVVFTPSILLSFPLPYLWNICRTVFCLCVEGGYTLQEQTDSDNSCAHLGRASDGLFPESTIQTIYIYYSPNFRAFIRACTSPSLCKWNQLSIQNSVRSDAFTRLGLVVRKSNLKNLECSVLLTSTL